MNKLQTSTPSLEYLSKAVPEIAVHAPVPGTSRRLIVLLPPESDHAQLTRRIWELAVATNSTVQLLGMCGDVNQESSLRRQLVTWAALIQDAKISVQTKVEIGNNWVDVVKRHYQPGDMIVCAMEQNTGIRRKPLSQILESNFDAPIYVLSGLTHEDAPSDRLSQLVAWLGFLGIVAGFFLLQARVIELTDNGFQTVLLVLLLVPEFWLLWIWNSLFV